MVIAVAITMVKKPSYPQGGVRNLLVILYEEKTMKIMKLIAASALVLGMNSAFANESLALTETQMDGVTAAGNATAEALALAFGLNSAGTLTEVSTHVNVLFALPVQGGVITKDHSQSLSLSTGFAF